MAYDGDSLSNYRLAAQLEATYQSNLQSNYASEYETIPGKNIIYVPSVLHQWPFRGNSSLFVGWSKVNDEDSFRWSVCDKARIIFRLGNGKTAGMAYILVLKAGAYGTQDVEVSLNGSTIGNWTFTDPAAPPQTALFPFQGNQLIPGEINEVEFKIPNARFSGIKEQRWLGLAFSEMAIFPAGDYPPSPPPE